MSRGRATSGLGHLLRPARQTWSRSKSIRATAALPPISLTFCRFAEERFCSKGVSADKAIQIPFSESPVQPVDPRIGDAALLREGPRLEIGEAEITCRPG